MTYPHDSKKRIMLIREILYANATASVPSIYVKALILNKAVGSESHCLTVRKRDSWTYRSHSLWVYVYLKLCT